LRTVSSLLAVAAAGLVAACDRAVVLNPKGPIAGAELRLFYDAFWVMMAVVVPVIVMAFLFAWRYRARGGNPYQPKWQESAKIDAVVWAIPAVIVLAVAVLVWRSTHKLDPYRPIAGAMPALEVQAVAQDWKWLFIYPQLNVASVNQMAIVAGRPVSIRITSDTVMNSFYVPALAGQIYAMAGMQTRLQMLANEPGRFVGRNTQYSGGGFSEQHFEVQALSQAEFDSWVARARQSPNRLDPAAYAKLAERSRRNPVTYYAPVEPGLFETIIGRYNGPHHMHGAAAATPTAPARR
jgi:cytochrome o ubiquinol oxidase subunit 2